MSFTARLIEKLPRFMGRSCGWAVGHASAGPAAVTSGTAGAAGVWYGSGTHPGGIRMRHAALFVAVCLAFAPAAQSAGSAKPVPAAELARSIHIPYDAFTL